ncbi:discoidin domain-containing protein [Cohnella silvisoli]|uniref:Discoidin domain-containing protein n=1 Tax=Cohnella silvisoli TaxID=2873699 RepID=A0ABV1KNJ9_9BACL|nr:discoidin domain-containing protein [Cohnella silvisoli]MCD9020637.1 discoidin domain-containing protein [Cohnella silvisoli]
MNRATIRNTLLLFAVFLLVTLWMVVQSVFASGSLSYDWRTNNNLDGWTPNAGIDAHLVIDGKIVMHVPSGSNDPTLTGPPVSIQASTFKIVEITYYNNTGNTNAQLFWTTSTGGWAAARSQSFSTISDSKWHTLQIDLSGNANWTGTITQLRFDPTTNGGNGNFELDSLRVLDKANRYSISNGYYSLSGVDGLIDTLRFDPTGAGNYSDDLIANNMYFNFQLAGVPYAGNSSVTASTSGTTLTLNGIGFGGSGISGSWTIALDGKWMKNTYTVTSSANGKKLESSGFTIESLWDNPGYQVNSLRNPFIRMADVNALYKEVHAFKRTNRSEAPFNLSGNRIDWQGANGFDFNLRFYPSTKRLNNLASLDMMYMNFPAILPTVLNTGNTLTHTLDIELMPSSDITPAVHARYEGGDSTVTTGANAIFSERNYGWEPGEVNPDWYEWQSLQRVWTDDINRDTMEHDASQVKQDPNGYVYTWQDSPGWPFPGFMDSNHYIMTSANLINGLYNHIMNAGDLNALKYNIDRMRNAMNYLLTTQYDSTAKLFIITNSYHNGTIGSVGSNYWDLLPFGHKSAYDNIYGYLALRRMAEIESMVGNTTRATQLNGYADDLKTAYNSTFWSTNHYVMNIDVNGVTRDYGGVFLNLEAIAYGLADTTKANAIMSYLSNTNTSAGTNDVFSKFVFAPRAIMFNIPPKASGGWWVSDYDGNGVYSSNQIQNGGAIFYTAYYELMSRLRSTGANDAYTRLQAIVNRFNLEHLSGGNPLYYGEVNQHYTEGLVGTWGEFPESGLVPVALKNGFMGISADKDGLHVKPNFPTSGMTSLTLNSMYYWDMKLKITASNTSVRIQALDNNSPYTDWKINGIAVSGLFDQTVPISAGGTVTLERTTKTYDLNSIALKTISGIVTADNLYKIYLNGKRLKGTSTLWETGDSLRGYLKNGVNTIAVEVTNLADSPGGFIGDFTLPDGAKVVSNTNWKVTSTAKDGWEQPGFDETGWVNATDYGAYGASPWGTNVVGFPSTSTARWIFSSNSTQSPTVYLRYQFNYELPTVTSSTSIEDTDFGKAKAVDGIRVPRSGANGFSSSTAFSDENHTEWLKLDLTNSQPINQLLLYPVVNSNYTADGFPVDFAIETSTDNVNWTIVKSYTGYVPLNPTEPQSLPFKQTNARYVRITATKLGIQQAGGYLFKIAEVEVYNR